jgi:signal peptidase
MKKISRIIKTIVDIILVVFVLAFVLVVCLQRFSNNELSVFGYRMFTVVSGSMLPEYEIGDVVISKNIPTKDIKVGDDVSYLGASGTFKGKVVTHRVVNIDKDVDGKLVFHTKGTANLVEDPLVYENQIYGVVWKKDKMLSFVYKTVATKEGMFLFIGIPILYIVGSEMISIMLEREEKRRAKLKEQKRQEKEELIKEEQPKEENKKEEKVKSTKKKTKK